MAGPSFLNTYGGSAVSPAQSAYSMVSLTANTTFYWPMFANNNPSILSRFMNVSATTPGLNMLLPDATLGSVGYDTVIFNSGANSFNVVSNTGTAIATIAPGTAWYITLTDNSTQSGAWLTLQFGAGTSSAQASALAGAGLAAMAGVLNLNLEAAPISTDFAVSTSSLSILYLWGGGAGVSTLPTSASLGDGFFFMLSNEGTGDLVVTCSGSDTIDGQATSTFAPGQSAFIVSSGTSWATVGKGTQSNFAFTLLNKNVAGNTDVTLSSTEAQNVFQTYTGALTGNINVIVPTTVQLYIVANDTTGAFTLTMKTAAGTGIGVPQSSTSILYCDGTNVLSAFSFVPSGSTFAGGSATSPGINWSGNTNTGIYQPTTNQVGVALGGLAGFLFTTAASSVNRFQTTASATGQPVIQQAVGTDGNISIEWLTKGTGSHIFQTGGGIQAEVTSTASAVNFLGLTGAATAGLPTISALGSDTNISLSLVPKGTGNVLLGIGALTPKVGLVGSGSGTVTVAVQAAAGTYNFNLPTTAGTAGQVLTSGGGVGAPMTWSSAGASGTVTSVASGTGLTGGPITTTGTLALATITNNTVMANISGGALAPSGSTLSALFTALLSGVKGALPICSATSTWSALGIGSTNQVLTVVSGAPAWAAATAGVVTVKGQTFTTSGTYTPSTGMLYAVVRMCGGGGGGGGTAAASNSASGSGGGGGALEAILTAAQVGASKAVTIGAAGTAGTAGTNAGGAGGTTSMSTLLSCTGGSAGGATTSGSATGGAGGTGTVSTGTSLGTITGQAGGNGVNVSIGFTGPGGSPGFGLGIGGPTNASNSASGAGVAGSGFGAGGSGAVSGGGNTGVTQAGAAGTAGFVTIIEYCSQ